MKRLFSTLAIAGLFVAGTNTVSANVTSAMAAVQEAAPGSE